MHDFQAGSTICMIFKKFQRARVIMVKNLDVSVIVNKLYVIRVIIDKLYVVCVIVGKLYVVSDDREETIFLGSGLNWIKNLAYDLMHKFLKIVYFLDSYKTTLLSVCVLVKKFQVLRAVL